MSDRRETWQLVDRVRERGYGLWTSPEKQRLHDLVVRLKSRGTISLDDLAWLRAADENLRGADALHGTFTRRRKVGLL
jgi:hypothetical protein